MQQFKSTLQKIARYDVIFIFTVMVVLLIVFSVASPFFLTSGNLVNIGIRIVMILIAAMGATLVISGGGIDMSQGGIAIFTAIVLVVILRYKGVGAAFYAVPFALFLGAFAGLINGLGITIININPFIMTIGMMMIARSSGELVSGDTTLSAPPEFAAFFFTGIAGTIIPYLLIPIVITAAMFILLSKTKFGFRVKGIGSNSRAAEYCGVRVVRYQIAIYVIMGLLSALVGIMLVARASGANPAEFTQLPLQAIAAVIIGGTSFGGGKGTVVGTLIGVVIVGSMENFLNLVRVDYYWQFVVQGFIVLAAVCLDHAIRRRDI